MYYVNLFICGWIIVTFDNIIECADFLKTFPEKGYVLNSVQHEPILHPHYKVVYWADNQ